MRPNSLQVGGTLYWVLRTRDPDTMLLKDADATPTVAVRKNGSAVGDSVTVTKRSATTGIYDCSYNPAAEAEGDTFEFEEQAQVTGTTTAQAYYDSGFVVRVRAVERGTDGANTTTPPTVEEVADEVQTRTIAAVTTVTTTTNLTNLPTIPANWLTASGIAIDAIAEIQSGLSTHAAADVLTALGTGSWATSLASQTSVDDLATATELAKVPKTGSTHRYTQIAQTSTTTDVAIGEAT